MPIKFELRIIVLLTIVFTISACGGGGGGGGSEAPSPVDRVAPVITLNGPATINHEQGTEFTDPGASAMDAVDGSVSVISSPSTMARISATWSGGVAGKENRSITSRCRPAASPMTSSSST